MFKILGSLVGFAGSKISLPIGFFAVLFGLLLVILVPNMSMIGTKLGFNTKEALQKQVNQDQTTIRDISAANVDMQTTIDRNTQTNQANLDAVVHHDAVTDSHAAFTDTIIKKRDAAVEQIKHKKISKVTNTPSSDTPSTEIAKVEIQAIWATYCEFNQDAACQAGS